MTWLNNAHKKEFHHPEKLKIPGFSATLEIRYFCHPQAKQEIFHLLQHKLSLIERYPPKPHQRKPGK